MSFDHTIEGPVLKLRSSREGDTHYLRLSGEFDASGYEPAIRELRRVEQSDAPRIVIDLSELTFMDSSGVRALAEAAMLSRAGTGRLKVRRGLRKVQRVLEISGIDEHLSYLD